MKTASLLLVLILFLQHAPLQAQAPLVVHEWGTFTSLHGESGQAIGGLNTDDEPVPEFVHSLQQNLLLWPTELPPAYFVKGYPRLHPDVTLRLETPVMYFYPPAGRALPLVLDVRASFLGGWLTEYYPQAAAKASNLKQRAAGGGETLGGLDEHTVGMLTWEQLRVGVDTPGPQTDAPVWLTPRRVRAAAVATQAGESEKYLFYRGVGHVESLLRVRRSAEGDWLEILGQAEPELRVRHAWLADIRQGGSVAFRPLGSLALGADAEEVLARGPARFAESEYSAAELADLRAAMRQGLIEEGLFADEAEAMLDTWEAAYFRSAGLRLFFTVPQAWTDHYLPLEFSEPVDLTRVMVGRIEIVTPEQRALLARIAATPVQLFPQSAMQERLEDQDLYQQVMRGEKAVRDLGVALPESFLAYLELGRMRNALILDELRVRPTPYLKLFVDQYQLAGQEVPGRDTAAPVPAPPSDLPILEDTLAEDWRIIGSMGAQVLGPRADGPVFAGQQAMAVQVRRMSAAPLWSLVLVPAQELLHPGYAGLHLAFHPGDTQLPATPALTLAVGELSVDLAPPAPGALDLGQRQWQVLEIPLRPSAGARDSVRTIPSIVLKGNLKGTFYLDEVRLVRELSGAMPTAVREAREGALPAAFSLAQNYPNPFNSQTLIRFALPRAAEVDLAVYNLQGQQVAQLLRGRREAGSYVLNWDGRDLGSQGLATGVYLYRLQAEGHTVYRKLLLLR